MVREGDIVALEYDPVKAKVRQALEDARTEEKVQELIDIAQGWLENDNLSNGAILRFEKRFEGTETIYLFAALKTNDKWYVTGPKFGALPGRTWEEFVGFLVLEGSPCRFGDVEHVTESEA